MHALAVGSLHSCFSHCSRPKSVICRRRYPCPAVLSGTKYKLKQSRGRFGLGAKMALLHSKMTTARPLEVFSAQEGKSYISRWSSPATATVSVPANRFHWLQPHARRWGKGGEPQTCIVAILLVSVYFSVLAPQHTRSPLLSFAPHPFAILVIFFVN